MRTLVLAFHGIGTPAAEIPRAEVSYWMPRESFSTFIKGAGAAARDLDTQIFATFDDGNRSDLEIAAPLLKENGINGAFFPCVGRLSDPNYLSAEGLRQITTMGFEIGSHGVDHVLWTTLDEPNLFRETSVSKRRLEDIIGAEVKSVAIPFGAYNRRVLKAIKSAGYSKIYCSDRGLAQSHRAIKMRWTFRTDEMFDIPRILAIARNPSHVLLTALKSYIKSHR